MYAHREFLVHWQTLKVMTITLRTHRKNSSWSTKLISITQTRLCAVELLNIGNSGKWMTVLLLFPIKQPERHSHEACKTIWYISYPQSSTVQEHRQTCCIYCFCISEYNGERRATWLSLVRRVEHICMHKTVKHGWNFMLPVYCVVNSPLHQAFEYEAHVVNHFVSLPTPLQAI
jgi:hypothetical protein